MKHLAAVALLIASTGCASLVRSTAHQGEASRRNTQVITAPAGSQADPLGTLEQELARVQSDRVIVSTALLRSLVKNGRVQQTQCKNISGPLEALKNIDLEETGETKE
jgi:hypothetical protein